MSGPEEKTILNSDDISRSISRIAREIIEKNEDLNSVVLVGIHTRGVPISKRIADNIQEVKDIEIPIGELDVTFYRDDIQEKGVNLKAAKTVIPSGLGGKTIVLVDDVLYTGRSIRAAVDHLIDLGRPARIQLAVLLDRGHRELPIKADYVGKNIPTSKSQRVQVLLSETDGEDKALLQDD